MARRSSATLMLTTQDPAEANAPRWQRRTERSGHPNPTHSPWEPAMTERSTLDLPLPDDLAALDDGALSTLHDDLVASFDREHDDSTPNLATLEAVAADITAIRAEADS